VLLATLNESRTISQVPWKYCVTCIRDGAAKALVFQRKSRLSVRFIPSSRASQRAPKGSALTFAYTRYSYCSALSTFSREARRAGSTAASVPAIIATTANTAMITTGSENVTSRSLSP
jgi:hypothetical protein